MKKLARQFSRRHFLVALLSLAAFKQFRGGAVVREGEADETVLAGGWLLKKSDLT